MNRLATASRGRLMRRRWPAAPFLLLTSYGAVRAWAAGEMIALPAGNETVQAYLAMPADPAPTSQKPGIVVVHHSWGLDGQTKSVTDRFAGLGYLTIAPDLYRGTIAADPGLADDLARRLDEGRAVTIVREAIGYLRKLDRSVRRPVALVGFDVGGYVSLAAARRGADVQGLVIFYGHLETDPGRLAPLKAEVLGFFGRDDPGIRAVEVKKFEEALKAAGRSPTIIIYPGVAHSFFDETRPDYDPELAKDAWSRIRDWLAVTLNPAQMPRPAPPAPGRAPSAGATPGR